MNEAEGESYAFIADAIVLYNDIALGTISSLVNMSSRDDYPELHKVLNESDYDINQDNAFVCELGLKGFLLSPH